MLSWFSLEASKKEADPYWITDESLQGKYWNQCENFIFNEEHPCRIPIRTLLMTVYLPHLSQSIKKPIQSKRNIYIKTNKIIFSHLLNTGYRIYAITQGFNIEIYYILHRSGCKTIKSKLVYTPKFKFIDTFTINDKELNISIFNHSSSKGYSPDQRLTQQRIDKFKIEQFNDFGTQFQYKFSTLTLPQLKEKIKLEIFDIMFPLSLPPENERLIEYKVVYKNKLNYDEIADLFRNCAENKRKIIKFYEKDIYMHNYTIKFHNCDIKYVIDNDQVKIYLRLGFNISELYDSEQWQTF